MNMTEYVELKKEQGLRFAIYKKEDSFYGFIFGKLNAMIHCRYSKPYVRIRTDKGIKRMYLNDDEIYVLRGLMEV